MQYVVNENKVSRSWIPRAGVKDAHTWGSLQMLQQADTASIQCGSDSEVGEHEDT